MLICLRPLIYHQSSRASVFALPPWSFFSLSARRRAFGRLVGCGWLLQLDLATRVGGRSGGVIVVIVMRLGLLIGIVGLGVVGRLAVTTGGPGCAPVGVVAACSASASGQAAVVRRASAVGEPGCGKGSCGDLPEEEEDQERDNDDDGEQDPAAPGLPPAAAVVVAIVVVAAGSHRQRCSRRGGLGRIGGWRWKGARGCARWRGFYKQGRKARSIEVSRESMH